MKYLLTLSCYQERLVALFTRAWIEITEEPIPHLITLVALFTRAWIEIALTVTENITEAVALFTRAWIEIRKP